MEKRHARRVLFQTCGRLHAARLFGLAMRNLAARRSAYIKGRPVACVRPVGGLDLPIVHPKQSARPPESIGRHHLGLLNELRYGPFERARTAAASDPSIPQGRGQYPANPSRAFAWSGRAGTLGDHAFPTLPHAWPPPTAIFGLWIYVGVRLFSSKTQLEHIAATPTACSTRRPFTS
jgi:hypothetical protein